MLEAIVSLTILGVVLGGLLGIAAVYLKVEGNPLVEEIDEMLPGTQCGQCGYPGCTPAAEALAAGEAEVTFCPPGGRQLAQALADKLGITVDLSGMEDKDPALAFVNEDLCIGCARCFGACPTDAIVGAPKMMHAVIPEYCTGCEACIDVCPTECIEMQTIQPTLQTWHWPKPDEEIKEIAA